MAKVVWQPPLAAHYSYQAHPSNVQQYPSIAGKQFSSSVRIVSPYHSNFQHSSPQLAPIHVSSGERPVAVSANNFSLLTPPHPLHAPINPPLQRLGLPSQVSQHSPQRSRSQPVRHVQLQKPGVHLQGSFPSQAVAVAEVQQLCNVISLLLEDRNVLKRAVIQCFQRAAKGATEVGPESLNTFRSVLARVLQVPVEVFDDIHGDLQYFDFDGNGLLEVNEIYKLVKFHLRQYRKQLCGESGKVEMPYKSMDECGFNITKELGRGSQGVAKLVQDRNGQQLCVKCLPKAAMSPSGMQELLDEFLTLKDLECDRITKVFELFQDLKFYYMVAEPYFGGDFMSLVPGALANKVQMTDSWWQNIFRQCSEGLQFMHEQAMMHCDIKEPNVMLKTHDFERPEVVYIDFGVCRAMVKHQNGDVFCLGVTLIQVLCGKSPPLGPRTTATPGGIFIEGCQTVQDMFQATLSRIPPFQLVPKEWSDMSILLQGMLSKDMCSRPTAKQVLCHRWFQETPTDRTTPLRSRNAWATIGITKSFLDRECEGEDKDSPAVEAIRKLRRTLPTHSKLQAEVDQEDLGESESDSE